MKTIKNIEIVFENCDAITIEPKYFFEFYISQIEPIINRIGCNTIAKCNIAKHIAFGISRNADEEYYQFGMVYQENFKKTYFNRIKDCDITAFDLHYEDGTHETIYVEYSADSYCTNSNQNYYVNNFGDLFVTIIHDKGVFDVFDKDDIEDENYMELNRHMMD